MTVLGLRGGATLVAVDLETVDADARTLEHGRLFRGHWSFRREDAYHEVLRLRSTLPLSAQVVQHIDEHLRHVLAEPEPVDQDWHEAPLRFATDRLDVLLRERTAVEHALADARDDARERDPRSGLYNDRFLARWTAGLGTGALPIGLALLRVFGITEVRNQYGLRAEIAAMQSVARTLQHRLTDVDRAIRLTGAASSAGSVAVSGLRPPPARRTRPSGACPASSSAIPWEILDRDAPLACATAAIPPSPSERASPARTNRCCRSSRCGNTTASLARNDSTTSARTATTTSWPTESQTEWLFLGEP